MLPRSLNNSPIGVGKDNDEELLTLYNGSHSGSQSDDEFEQLQQGLQEYKRKCRILEDEKLYLMRLISKFKDGEGIDITQELKSLMEKEQMAIECKEYAEKEYHNIMTSFASYKKESDENRKVQIKRFSQLKARAEREEAENKQLREVIAHAGIELEIGPNGAIRQALDQQHHYMNTPVRLGHNIFGPRMATTANFLDQRYSSMKSASVCHTAIPMPIPSSSPHCRANKKASESCCVTRDSFFTSMLILAFITLIVVLFVHIFMFFRQL